MKGTPAHLVGKEKSRKRKKKKNMIQVGDTVNLSDLLFTKYRDYLIVHITATLTDGSRPRIWLER
ncbi:hypothetical protein OROMI_021850 [Orobanche minor]